MNGLREKFRNKKGFTLIEMLIVVAIIAILIAISIPMVGSALEKAREATDAANERAFKAALVSSYLLDTAGMNDGTEVKAGEVYAYDAVNGKIGTGTAYGVSKDRKGMTLYGMVNATGEVTMKWHNAALTKDNIATTGTVCISPTVIGNSAKAETGSTG